MELNKKKQEYNYWIKRNNGAEVYFREKTIKECLEHIELFQQITRNVAEKRRELEKLMQRELTEQETWNGFDV